MSSQPPLPRVRAVDVARGLVMVLMAVDHVRVAPGFVFFAGTSALLRGSRGGETAELSRYLLTRGMLIVLLEMTVMRFAWTFNFDVMNYNLAGVLWMIGWSMVALAGLVWLPFNAIAAVGLVIVLAHNIADPYIRDIGRAIGESPWRWVWQFLYFGGSVTIGDAGPRIAILYSLVPWIGVMAAGYAFGRVLQWPIERRNRACLAIGGVAIAAFIILRASNLYGDPRPWSAEQPLTFLNTTKYPASLLFLLMTLGPLIGLMPLFERARGAIADALALFGRVPLFYYVLHIPLIHVAAMVVSLTRTGSITPWLFANHPMEPPDQPEGYRWSLWLLYLVTGACVLALYGACRWWVARKRPASGRLANPLGAA
jgi:uncharacterized membrane protein